MDVLLNDIATHFNTTSDTIELLPIQHGIKHKQNVYRLKIKDNNYILKFYEISQPVTQSGFTPREIEQFTLTTLHNNGCQVPQVIWELSQHNALLLEWCGDQTLDDLAQGVKTPNLSTILQNSLNSLCQIELVFEKYSDKFTPYIFEYDYNSNLKRILEQGKKTISYLTHLNKKEMSTSAKSRLEMLWETLSNLLIDSKPTLGTLDYQARNIVINDDMSFFIDFGSVGLDWQERRVIQYINSVGANYEEGNFVSMLDKELVEYWVNWRVQDKIDINPEEFTSRVDGHHLLYYLSIIHRLLEVVARPDEQDNRILLESWGDAGIRFKRAINIICETKLSYNSCVVQLREIISELHQNA
ncbi:phosphotransferase [Candidatus Poribacteria bacterium]|nr:phosphotransferase [Candidatus Poribacteria bacterium]